MEKNNKRTIKDILAEVDKVRSTSKPREDITGLEDKIPLVNGKDKKASKELKKDSPEPSNEELLKELRGEDDTKESIEKKDPDEDIMSTPRTDVFKINKIEDLEDKIVQLEKENRKLRMNTDSQKTELETALERLAETEKENKRLKSELSNAESNVKVNFEAQLNKASVIEEKYQALAKTHEEMKARVRRDIRKISVRERELSNKIELMKNDSETLLKAKDNKILQLKQHIDNLEFEIDTLKDKLATAQEQAKESEEKAERVVKALRLSTSLLETAKKEE